MKYLIPILIFLLICSGAEAKYSPALEMGGKITMNGYNITTLVNGTAAQDAVTYSQAVMLSAEPYVTVGPYEWCDYITDGTADQVQIDAALDASKDVRLVADATYHISAAIQVDEVSHFLGSTSGARYSNSTIIYQDTAGANGINITAASCHVSGLTISNNTGVTSSKSAIYINASSAYVDSIFTSGMYNGIWVAQAGQIATLRDITIDRSAGTAVYMAGSESFAFNVRADGSVSQGTYGFYVTGCGNFFASGCEMIRCGANFYIVDTACAKFVGCYFDQGDTTNDIGATNGAVTRSISFTDCWFAGLSGANVALMRFTVAGTGAIYDIKVIGGQFRDSYADTIIVNGATISHLRFEGIQFLDCARSAAGSLFSISASPTHFTIIGCGYHALSAPQTCYGIYMNNNEDYYVITNNDFTESAGIVGDDGAHELVANLA
jgi:hypothetical protein